VKGAGQFGVLDYRVSMNDVQGTTEVFWQARTKDELIVEVWQALESSQVGAHELQQIQHAIREKFGEGAVNSPASIARTLAERGAALRHPEVLDFDSQWRSDQMFADPTAKLSFDSLINAAASLEQLEAWRKAIGEDNETKLARLRELAIEIKNELLLVYKSKFVVSRTRREALEVARWLTVWMEQPALFTEWLSLRRRSLQFIRLFGETTD